MWNDARLMTRWCDNCHHRYGPIPGRDGRWYCTQCALAIEHRAHRKTVRDITFLVIATTLMCAVFILASLALYGSVNW